MTNIVAKHRIITDACRERPIEDVISETVQSVESAIRGALEGWPPGAGTEIHAKVEVVRAPPSPDDTTPEDSENGSN